MVVFLVELAIKFCSWLLPEFFKSFSLELALKIADTWVRQCPTFARWIPWHKPVRSRKVPKKKHKTKNN